MRLFGVVTFFLAGLSSPALSALSQFGFPARCSVYATCDFDNCSPLDAIVFSPMALADTLVQEDGVLFWEKHDSRRVKLGLFDAIELADAHLKAGSRPDFSTVAVFNRDISDAFGIDLVPIVSEKETFTLSDQIIKIVCSRIGAGLY